MGTRMEVPPPFANLQASRGAKRRRISWQEEPGGGWRSAGVLGNFWKEGQGLLGKPPREGGLVGPSLVCGK